MQLTQLQKQKNKILKTGEVIPIYQSPPKNLSKGVPNLIIPGLLTQKGVSQMLR